MKIIKTQKVIQQTHPPTVQISELNLDITAPDNLEILIRDDSKVIWINIDGICVFRACKIGSLVLNDERKSK